MPRIEHVIHKPDPAIVTLCMALESELAARWPEQELRVAPMIDETRLQLTYKVAPAAHKVVTSLLAFGPCERAWSLDEYLAREVIPAVLALQAAG